jgi:hypothetical protein
MSDIKRDIKVIEGLEPWEVLKKAGEGATVVYRLNEVQFPHLKISNNAWIETPENFPWRIEVYDFAILDTHTPEIDWDKFNWDFFNQWNGLVILRDGKTFAALNSPTFNDLHYELCESPFYYWAGGEQPVPDNVEVEVSYRDMPSHRIMTANGVDWSYGGRLAVDVIGFKLTGRVL